MSDLCQVVAPVGINGAGGPQGTKHGEPKLTDVERAACSGRRSGTQPGAGKRQAWAQLKLSVSCSDLQSRRLRLRGAFAQ